MTFSIDSLPYVACSHQTPRGDTIDLIVVHTNEGPKAPTGAEGLASYLHSANVSPGYHIVVDENSAIRCAQDAQRVNGAGGVNDRALHICLVGYAGQSREQWLDPASRAEIAIASSLAQQWAKRHNIPWKRLTPSEVENGRGVCGHGDVSVYHAASLGHTDPGQGFPWDVFMAGAAPAPPPTVPEDEMTEFFYTHPSSKDVFYVANHARSHVTKTQRELIEFAAGKAGHKIPDLGVFTVDQLTAIQRWPQVGTA